jgi:hypothetical protein
MVVVSLAGAATSPLAAAGIGAGFATWAWAIPIVPLETAMRAAAEWRRIFMCFLVERIVVSGIFIVVVCAQNRMKEVCLKLCCE